METKTFGQRIKAARKNRKMNQVELASKAGIKQPTLSDIETGETKMLEGDTLVAISSALRVSPEWIMTGRTQDGVGPHYVPNNGDQMLYQLIDLYGQLSDDAKHELVQFANFKQAQENPRASPSNPFPGVKRKPK